MNIQEQIEFLRISGSVFPVGSAEQIADTMERLNAVYRVLKSGYGCWYPKDCCHMPEETPTQSCCDWCLARYKALAAVTQTGE